MSESEVPVTKSRQGTNQITTCKVQGEHGVIPPDQRIVETVEAWLDELELEGQDERTVYALEIAGWKCFSGKEGVTLFRVRDYPFDESLELRVRVHEERDFLWRCFLFCPSRELAWQIALYARTDAYNWISALINKREALPSFKIQSSNRDIKRAYAYSKSRDKSEKEVIKLSRGRGLKKLCWSINKAYSVDQIIPVEKLIDFFEKESGVKFSKDSCYDLMKLLLDRGVLDPFRDNNENGYRATAILQERAFDYINIQRVEQINRLETRLDSICRSEVSSAKEVVRLEGRIAELKLLLERLSSEKDDIKNSIQALRSVVTGSYDSDED